MGLVCCATLYRALLDLGVLIGGSNLARCLGARPLSQPSPLKGGGLLGGAGFIVVCSPAKAGVLLGFARRLGV